jgi:hypothetical protein
MPCFPPGRTRPKLRNGPYRKYRLARDTSRLCAFAATDGASSFSFDLIAAHRSAHHAAEKRTVQDLAYSGREEAEKKKPLPRAQHFAYPPRHTGGASRKNSIPYPLSLSIYSTITKTSAAWHLLAVKTLKLVDVTWGQSESLARNKLIVSR